MTTSMARDPVRVGGALVHTQADRDLAVAQWLLLSAPDKDAALDQWRTTRSAVLSCGSLFTAVALPELLVHAAAGTAVHDAVADFLRETVAGPVVYDFVSRRYHALVPPSTARLWPAVLRTACAGPGELLTVPVPGQTRPGGGRTYWATSMDGPGALCLLRDVALVALAGQARVQDRGGS
ncbi:hypothetical protein ACFWH1_28170 [Streptomyces sp. NPDC127037]|uniref:hypothetical protein n=1 Tax=Streptomyces sp. NPDC127037 TaxID=3347113 RepID=UPI00365B740B